jgi:HEAT repeat protein
MSSTFASEPRLLVEQLKNLHQGPLVLPDVIRLGKAAIPALERLLRGHSQALHHSRCMAADALGAIGGPLATAALVRALRDCIRRELDAVSQEAEAVVVNRIAEHLGRCPNAEITDALLEALSARPYPACAAALGACGDPRAIQLLVGRLGDDCSRPAAAGALSTFGSHACPALIDALTSPHTPYGIEPPSQIDARATAAQLLGKLSEACSESTGVAAAQALGAALKDVQRKVRIEAALALARRTPPQRLRAAEVLSVGLDETNWAHAEVIVDALTAIGPEIEPLIVSLIGTLSSDEGAQRRRLRAIMVAGRLHFGSAIAPIGALRDAPDKPLRLAAVSALSQICGANDALASFLADPEPGVRRRALLALRDRQALSVETAAVMLADADKGIRHLAADLLCRAGPAGPAAVRRLMVALGSSQRGLHSRARLCWHACRWLMSSDARYIVRHGRCSAGF